MGGGLCGGWVGGCVESGLRVVWRVGWGLCGEWVESCVESGLRVVLRMG